MSSELIQFNSGDHSLGDKNIVEAISTDGDIVFNESYIVVGAALEAKHIHATYDLSVIGNIVAEKITINGALFVQGSIEAESLVCRGSFICTGEVRIKELDLGSYSIVYSIIGEELRSAGDLFAHTTVDTNSLLEVGGLVVAGEGILGDGDFQAKAAIANDYFEFNGNNSSSVFEISTMEFSNPVVHTPTLPEPKVDIQEAIAHFISTLAYSINEWSKYEEDELICSIRNATATMPDLHAVDKVFDVVVELSYEREITNFRDYLCVLFAKNVFTDELARYETLEPVLTDMFDAATPKIESMEYKSTGIADFARSLYILSNYYSKLPISMEDGADKIFSSIGLRYSTVEHAWRDYNG